MPEQKKYRWDCAHQWLTEGYIQKLVDTSDIDTLQSITRDLAMRLDCSEIQDMFESTMDRDGFFDELTKEEDENES